MSADRTPPADMSGYDRSVRTAKASDTGDFSKREYRLALASIGGFFAVCIVVIVAIAVLAVKS